MKENVLNIWGGGQLLGYSGLDGKTDFENGLTVRTSFNGTGLIIKLPGEAVLSFSENLPDNLIIAGDFFDISVSGKTIKGAFIDAYHLLINGPLEVASCDEKIAYAQENEKFLIGTKQFFDADKINLDVNELIIERKKWIESVSVPEELPEIKQRTAYKALSQIKTQVCTAEGQIKHRWTTPDRWPHRQMWLWDSVFHAIGIRHFDPSLARDAIDAMLDTQREDGFIPLCASPSEISSVTQPPVLALAAKMVHEISPSKEWIADIYPKLKAYIEWDLANRDSDGAGLVEWHIEGSVTCRSGESGMDNSPRFDSATHLDATDFNAFISLECEILAEFAEHLSLSDDARKFREQHAKLNQLINDRLWNEDQGFYFDYDVETKQLTEVMASSGFLPLICGAPSKEQALQLAAHLSNPETFATALPVASIAKNCEAYYSKDMWRGPVWINVNWLIVYGLRRYGLKDEADMVVEKMLSKIDEMYLKYGVIFEFYDDRSEVDPPKLLRKAENIPDTFHQVFHDYGWSATLYVDLVNRMSQ